MLRTMLRVAVLLVLLEGAFPAVPVLRDGGQDDDHLPDGFLFGAGVSAFQTEGAVNVGGKTESILQFAMNSKINKFPPIGDVCADHYHRYKEDLALAKQMRLTSHRFSIAWTRIFPNGDDTPNTEGVEFYRDYIKEIKKNGMEPMVTMYHFDHPVSVERNTSGWTSRDMVEKFVKYADFLFFTYGNEVKYWNPLNEMNEYCIFALIIIATADQTSTTETSYYKCLHHAILAHAKVYRLYQNKYKKSQKGLVGSSVLLWPATPFSEDFADVEASNIMNDVMAGSLVHPIVHGGEYPPITRYLVDKRSTEHGLPESKLPHFTQEEKETLFKDVATDFLGINVYSGYKVALAKNKSDVGLKPHMLLPPLADIPEVKVISGGGFDGVEPTLLRTSILWAWTNYHVPIVITENGQGDTKKEGVRDVTRTAYHTAMLRSLITTMNEYKIPVISYHAWSLIDSYEFKGGYDRRPFGLIHVDFKSGKLERTIKDSSQLFIQMAKTRRAPAASSSACVMAPSMALVLIFNLYYCLY